MTTQLYAFWPKPPKHYHLLHGRRMVFRWKFYRLHEEDVADCPIPYEVVDEDESAVGTRLKNIFSAFGVHAGRNCNCESIARMMDSAGLRFLEGHHDELVDLIVASAAQMHVPAPKFIVSRMLRIARKREERCLAKSDDSSAASSIRG